jgi:hypothetical protein
MWNQVSNSQLQYKEEILEAIQAAAKFNEEILNTVNLILHTFQEANIRNNDPNAEQFKESQERIVHQTMIMMRDQRDEMKKEMKNWDDEDFKNFKDFQNSSMANFESSLLHKLVVELGKIQTNLSAKFNNLTPIFKQLQDKIVEQGNAILENNKRIEQLPENIKGQYSIARKEIEDDLAKTNPNLINRVMNVLHEQNRFIQQIHQDGVGKLSIKQLPLLTQAAPITLEGNDNFYSILRTMANQLHFIKKTILTQFTTKQENIADIDKRMELNDEG